MQTTECQAGCAVVAHGCLLFLGEIFELKAELNSDKKEKKKEAVKKVIASMTVGKDVRCAGVHRGARSWRQGRALTWSGSALSLGHVRPETPSHTFLHGPSFQTEGLVHTGVSGSNGHGSGAVG